MLNVKNHKENYMAKNWLFSDVRLYWANNLILNILYVIIHLVTPASRIIPTLVPGEFLQQSFAQKYNLKNPQHSSLFSYFYIFIV